MKPKEEIRLSNTTERKDRRKPAHLSKHNNKLKHGDLHELACRKSKEAENLVEGLKTGAKNENWPITSWFK